MGGYFAYKRFRKGSSCCGDIAQSEKVAAVADKNKSHYPYSVKLKIEGMTCNNCKTRVENSLNALDGLWAKVDLGSGTAVVRSKTPQDTRRLCTEVAKAGYTAKPI